MRNCTLENQPKRSINQIKFIDRYVSDWNSSYDYDVVTFLDNHKEEYHDGSLPSSFNKFISVSNNELIQDEKGLLTRRYFLDDQQEYRFYLNENKIVARSYKKLSQDEYIFETGIGRLENNKCVFIASWHHTCTRKDVLRYKNQLESKYKTSSITVLTYQELVFR